MNLSAGLGVAVREFPMAEGHGDADYLLFIDRKAVGVIEAKEKGEARVAESADPTTEEDRAATERLASFMTFERFIDLPEPMPYSR